MNMENCLLFFILLYIKIKASLEQVDQSAYAIEERIGTKSIMIGNNIVYIFNNNINSEIKVRGDEIPDSSYNKEILYHKDILKINESNFIIIGLNYDNKICFENYAIENNNITLTKELNCYDAPNNYPYSMEAKYIEKDKLIIYTVELWRLKYYYIDFNFNESSYKSIQIASLDNDPKLSESPYPFIKCDSYGGLSYFCIYYYRSTNAWKLNYTYGNFSSNIQASGSLCNDLCTYGNIIKVKETIEKYLICYVKIQFTSNKIYNIICQYYYFQNGKLHLEKYYDLCKDSGKIFHPRPLILYLYKNSLFLQYDYEPAEGETSRIIMFTQDLKLNIQSNIYAFQYSNYESINLMNNESIIYLIFEKDGLTNIKEQTLLSSGEDENITLSNENNYLSHLTLKNRSFVAFSLDENIILTKSNEIIAGNGLLDFSNLPSSETDYSIEKQNNAVGVFNNYICFMEGIAEGNYKYFSLIKKITIIICYCLRQCTRRTYAYHSQDHQQHRHGLSEYI